MIFKIYNSDFGFVLGGQKYYFDDVKGLTIDDPEKNNLTRGANGTNKIGLSFKEGLKDAKRWTVTIMNMSAALKNVLEAAFNAQSRMDVFCVDRSDQSSKWGKNSLLANRPQQLSLDDSADSIDVHLEFVTFDSTEVHKS